MELLAESDFYEHVAGYRLLLAPTLVECGKPDEARAAATEALAIYEAKGDRPAAGWAASCSSRSPEAAATATPSVL